MLFAADTESKLNRQALQAREDEAALEELIRKNRRFILGVASRSVRRFVSESDDEWSVALIAFHEAVRTYEESKGSFKSFSALVIKRRLLDYADTQNRRRREIAVDFAAVEHPGENEAAPVLETQKRLGEEAMAREGAESETRDEIEAVQQLLGGYGFSFFDLAECSPKAKKTKAACARVILALLEDGTLLAQLRRSGTLPVKVLCQRAGVPRKILENHRKYIIAAAEILDGDYPHLAEYLRYVRKGVETA